MTLALHDISIPVFIRTLDAMSDFLRKGRAFADKTGLDHSKLLQGRLYEDMAPLTAQIQRASDTAKNAAVRVGALPPLPMDDNEVSFDDLEARIAATVAFLQTVPASAMNGREEAEVIFKTRTAEITFTGQSYLLTYALPNFFFHVTTAYAILRHNGVPLGKMDFLGAR
ncbi:DUF1993 family protein [Mesorhizobium sp. NBSH29]|uniref:DUF1993 domain-containing protein n=1 Tax=Mesorhizobium sp. NBSH29 TaxID=2654249 RepID=UPI00189645CC|nr:DUF1993 domain-containing protein [Mesorhizobium sp. NBSH29]QPC87301.1 DUF1993 family protein [Mesorhizobium sp. NBSH29]